MASSSPLQRGANGIVSHEQNQGADVVLATPSSGGDEDLSLVEAAKLIGASPTTVMRRISEGVLPASKDGGAWRLSRQLVLEVGPAIRRRGARPAADRERDRGALAARVFPLLRAAVPLDEVCERLEADPAIVRGLFEEWTRLRALSAAWLAHPQETAVGPRFDHTANAEGTCCPGHAAQRRMQTTRGNNNERDER
jgi:excisionase family DNA binding protein